MKWLSNIYDPHRPDAFQHALMESAGEDWQDAWQNHLNFLRDKIILEPKATDKHTVKELEEMGMVGVYSGLIKLKEETKEERISRLEKAGIIDPDCPRCRSFYESPDGIGEPGPGHQPSRLCNSGNQPHCSCDACF